MNFSVTGVSIRLAMIAAIYVVALLAGLSHGAWLNKVAQNVLDISSSGVTVAIHLGGKFKTQAIKGLSPTKSTELVELEAIEVLNLKFEPVPLQDGYKCPARFLEPSRFEEVLIKKILETIDQTHLVPIPANNSDFERVYMDYLYARRLTDNQILLSVRAPPRYDHNESRFVRVKWYHEFIDEMLPAALTFISEHPNHQFIFSGIDNGASIALLMAWQCYAKAPAVNMCGGSKNKLNQIAAVLFGENETFTKAAIDYFKLGHRNIIRFFDTERQSSTFGKVGFAYTIPADTLNLPTRDVPYQDAHQLLYNEPDWSAAYMSSARAYVNSSASSKLSAQHRRVQYFKTFSSDLFTSASKEYVDRDMIAIADALKGVLEQTLKINTVSMVSITCSVEEHDFDDQYGRIKCEIGSIINGEPFKFKFVTYELVYGDDDERMRESLSGREVIEDDPDKSEWNKCIKELLSRRAELKVIDPSQKHAAFKVGYKTIVSDSRALVRIFSTSSDLKTLIEYSMSLFRLLVEGTGLFDQPIPTVCEPFCRPVPIPNSEKGNADTLFSSVSRFMKELEDSMKSLRKATIEETNSYRIINYWSSIPPVEGGSEAVELPGCLEPIMDNLKKCLDSNSPNLFYNCKDRANVNTGKGICPIACKATQESPKHMCSRVKPCGNGLYVALRGGGYVPTFSSADREHSEKTRLDPEESQMLSICFIDKSGATKNSYVTVFIDTVEAKIGLLKKKISETLRPKRSSIDPLTRSRHADNELTLSSNLKRSAQTMVPSTSTSSSSTSPTTSSSSSQPPATNIDAQSNPVPVIATEQTENIPKNDEQPPATNETPSGHGSNN